MGFIQPCFIRKNTPDLRKKLEELGYEPSFSMGKYPEVYKNIAVCTFFENRYYGLSEKEARHSGDINDAIKNRGLIDCGDNEELFIALASLRDDTDMNQWFIYNTINNTVGKFETIEWVLCKDNNICDYLNWGNCYEYCYKATVEELIEHFKKE